MSKTKARKRALVKLVVLISDHFQIIMFSKNEIELCEGHVHAPRVFPGSRAATEH